MEQHLLGEYVAYGTGGKQSTPGNYYENKVRGSVSISQATFGIGGSQTELTSDHSNGGGGGGWYGGGVAKNHNTQGGGGSGYVYTSSTASNYPSGCLLNSSYYLTNAQIIAGNQSFPNVSGTGNETGHPGNGAAKITPVN